MANKLKVLQAALSKLVGASDDLAKRVKPEVFAQAVEDVRPLQKGAMRIGDMLSKYTPTEYKAMRTFLTPDSKSGFALTKDGELVSVFSAAKGRGEKLARQATAQGATKLDNFDIQNVLPTLYGKAGFKETARYGYDPQYAGELSDYVNAIKPDVVNMELDSEIAKKLAMLRFAGGEDVARLMQGEAPRLSRNKNLQNLLATGIVGGGLTSAINYYD
jgi:hypothetical protein